MILQNVKDIITRLSWLIIMATMFEPSLSTSAMRPHLSADAPSTADSLPSINFGFEDLRERMARFSERFDEFIARGRKQVLEERNQFRISVAELQGNVYGCPRAGGMTNALQMPNA